MKAIKYKLYDKYSTMSGRLIRDNPTVGWYIVAHIMIPNAAFMSIFKSYIL